MPRPLNRPPWIGHLCPLLVVLLLPLAGFGQLPDSLAPVPRVPVAPQDTLPADTAGPGTQVRDTSQRAFGFETDAARQAFLDSLRQRPRAQRPNPKDTARVAVPTRGSADSPVDYQAQDSLVFNLKANTLDLYNEGSVDYEDMNLKAAHVQILMDSSLMKAEGILNDSTGLPEKTPVFRDATDTYQAEDMVYNYQTRKGRIRYVQTTQEGETVFGDVIKRQADGVVYIKGGKYCPCYEQDSGFYFRSRKLKIIPNDKIISGPALMYISDVPTPLFIPFGFFPQTSQRKSGVILPQYGEAGNEGFFFQNFGYYWAASPYYDMTFYGTVFTRGSYGFQVQGTYARKTPTAIATNYSLQFNQTNGGKLRRDPDFAPARNFSVNLNHRQTLNPASSFDASINVQTSGFLQNVINNAPLSNQQLTQTNFTSSLNYQNSFPNSAWTLNAGARLIQNTTTQRITLELPTLSVNRRPWFPFKRRVRVGSTKWYEDFQVSYSARLVNRVSNILTENLFKPSVVDSLENGIVHNVGITKPIKLFQYININPSINYREYWYLKEFQRSYTAEASTGFQTVLDTTISGTDTLVDTLLIPVANPTDVAQDRFVNGFLAGRDFNVSVSASTNLYSTLQIKGRRKFALRHTLTPNIGYTYRPDFAAPGWNFYRTVERPIAGTEEVYSRFPTTVGGPPSGAQQALTFSLNNVLEAKYLPKAQGSTDSSAASDTNAAPKFKYLRILDQLRLSTSYNFVADSNNLEPIRLTAATSILGGKVSFNFNGTLDPYAYVPVAFNANDEPTRYQRSGTYLWAAERKLLRLRSGAFGVNTNFRFSDFPRRKPENLSEARKALNKNYQAFQLPVALSVGYNLQYQYNELEANPIVLTHALSINGDVVWGKWKAGFQTNYDFVNNRLGRLNVNLSRDIGCWTVGFRGSFLNTLGSNNYFFSLAVKAQRLQDLKFDKNRTWQDVFPDQ